MYFNQFEHDFRRPFTFLFDQFKSIFHFLVDEMDLSDTSPESPIRSKTNVAAVTEPMKLSTFSNLSMSTVPGSMSLASLQVMFAVKKMIAIFFNRDVFS